MTPSLKYPPLVAAWAAGLCLAYFQRGDGGIWLLFSVGYLVLSVLTQNWTLRHQELITLRKEIEFLRKLEEKQYSVS